MSSLLIVILPVIISVSGALIGLFIALYPVRTIEMQKKFYESINWRIEPISMEKEIRNTRLMGLSLIVLGLLTIAAILAYRT